MKRKTIAYQIFALLFVGLLMQNITKAADYNNSDFEAAIKEKVVLFTDRDLYLSGEKILFSARVFVDGENVNSELSKILYVEVFKEKKAFVQSKFRIEKGLVEGDIILPSELLSGNYYIRAYTMLMRNGEPENFSNTLIRVVNPERKLEDSVFEPQEAIITETEGAKFVDGLELETVILYNKITNNSVEKAFVVNSKNDTLSEILVNENGFGSFQFTSKLNENYWMKLLLKSGDSVFKKLDNSQSSGFVLNFDIGNYSAKVLSQTEFRNININLIVFNSEFKQLNNKEVVLRNIEERVTFDNLNLKSGVNYLVAKKQDGTILYVKPFYFPPKNTDYITAELNKTSYSNRDEVEIKVKDFEPNDLLSYSVVKAGLLLNEIKNLPMEFVFNPLLLNSNSELISSFNTNILNQIELSFILNQGIFNSDDFKKKFSDEKSEKIWIPEIRDLSISGTIRNKVSKQPLVGERIYATVLGKQPQIHSYLSDVHGDFVFSLNQLQGTKDVALTMDTINDIDAEIIVFSDFCNRFPSFKDFPIQIDSTFQQLLEAMFRNQQIAYKFEELILDEEEFIDTVPFPFQDVQASIVLDDFISLATMQEVFNEIVTYVSARKRAKKFHLNVLNESTEILYGNPLVLIDNLPIFDIDELMKINPAKVEKIEVITKPYSFGEQNFKGIILITTKTNDFGGMKFPNETVFLIYNTSTLSSRTLFPQFDNNNKISSTQPYFSNTIYWNRNFKEETNVSENSFFTSDEKGDFELVVKRINSKGEVSRKILNFMVK